MAGPAAPAPPSVSPPSAGTGKVSPQSVLSAPRRPVTRYRPAVIAAAGGGVVVLVGVGFMVGFGGGHHGRRPPDATPAAADPAPAPDLGAGAPGRYDDPAARLAAQPVPPLADPNAASGMTPAVAQGAAAGQGDTAAAALDQRHREAQAAQASTPFFQGAGASRPVEPAISPAGRAELALASAQGPGGTAKEQFIARAGGGPGYVAALPRAPLSPYEIKAGAVIPAALVTGLNSDLPGPVIAQVTEPVFDHATGRLILIPQGSRLIGKYDSQVSYGQDRALVVWTRLIFPSGRSIDLGAMIGADPTGAGGLADRVDRHLPVLARAIGLSTLIAIGASAAQNSGARGSDNLVLQDGASGLSASASQTGQRLVERDLQRAPTLKIRPGAPLRVIVDKDLILPPEGGAQ